MLADLYRRRNEQSRSICPENPTGEPGHGGVCPLEEGSAREAARELGTGWKVNPYFDVAPHETLNLAEIQGPGAINHIWMTPTGNWRSSILRIYWDDQLHPSVETPVGDFFCMGWGHYAHVNSMAVCVNPGSAFNCYWVMPFRKRCRITLENQADESMRIYYQIDYCLKEIAQDALYFHAQFRRVNPLPYKQVYTLLDGVSGPGHYVGTYMAWGVNNCGWWGEGEIKFYLDADRAYPTICGTGTEDYFCASYNFEDPVKHDRYLPFSTNYSGLPQILVPDRLYCSQFRFGMYRWHLTDPICFETAIRVTIQALGWRSGRRYLPLRDVIASVAYWYQALPTAPFPLLPDKDALEVV